MQEIGSAGRVRVVEKMLILELGEDMEEDTGHYLEMALIC